MNKFWDIIMLFCFLLSTRLKYSALLCVCVVQICCHISTDSPADETGSRPCWVHGWIFVGQLERMG